MDEIFKPLLSGTTPSPPKFNVNVTWSALAPMDEKKQPPNITFAYTRAETLRFGGAGVQHSACCRVWIFCPSTVGSYLQFLNYMIVSEWSKMLVQLHLQPEDGVIVPAISEMGISTSGRLMYRVGFGVLAAAVVCTVSNGSWWRCKLEQGTLGYFNILQLEICFQYWQLLAY